MDVPSLSIDAEIKALWPETRLGCLFYETEIREAGAALSERIEALLPSLRAALESAPLSCMPNLAEARAAFKAFGGDPGRRRVSSEALYRRVRGNKPLYRVDNVVDVNNLVSLETGFSLGSYDLDAAGAKAVFRLGREGESYEGVGKGAVDLRRTPLLADERGPFGCPVSDSVRTMIVPGTRRALTVVYSFSSLDRLEAALALAEERFAAFAGASRIRTCVVDGSA